jgi:hypothetical protein
MNNETPSGKPHRVWQLYVVAMISGVCFSAATWIIVREVSRASRISESLVRYDRKWEANVFFGGGRSAQAVADHKIFLALKRARGSTIDRPIVCSANLDINYAPGGDARKAALMIFWIGDRPGADAILLRLDTHLQHLRQEIPLGRWQVSANKISSRSGVVYDAVVVLPTACMSCLPPKGSLAQFRAAVATALGGKRTSNWYPLSKGM